MSINKRTINLIYEENFNYEQFLRHHYHHLTRVIEPRHFFSYLRTKIVLTLDDQEFIMKSFHTTYMQAGTLIDLISKKGHKGFVAFMEVVEYNYPYLFSDITNCEPRKPPLAFEPVRRDVPFRSQNSMNIIGLMGSLTTQLTNEVLDKRQQLNDLQKLVDEIKDALRAEEDRNNSMCNEVELANERLRIANNHIEEMSQNYANLTEEHKDMKHKIEKLIIEKEHYSKQCDQLRLRCEDISSKVEKQNSNANNVYSGYKVLEILKSENLSLRKQLISVNLQTLPVIINDRDDNYPVIAPKPSIVTSNHSNLNQQFKQINEDNIQLQFLADELQVDNNELKSVKIELESRCSCLEDNAVQTRKTIEMLLIEKNKEEEKLKVLEEKLTKEIGKNDQLRDECDRYAEIYSRMILEIENLKKELSTTHEMNEESRYIKLFVPRRRIESCDQLSQAEKSNQKRHGALQLIYPPLIVYGPQHIELQILQRLKTEFNSCPIELIPSCELDKQICDYEILQYFDSTPEGVPCITITKLQKIQSSVLLVVPWSCITCLLKRSIKPIIAVVKFDSTNGTKSEVEIFLNENKIKYEILNIDDNIENDIEKIVNKILPNLKKLIEDNKP